MKKKLNLNPEGRPFKNKIKGEEFTPEQIEQIVNYNKVSQFNTCVKII